MASKKYCIIAVATIALAGWIWLVVWLNVRPINISVTAAESDATTAPSLVKFGLGGEAGQVVRIDETRFVADDAVAAYLLTVEGIELGGDRMFHLTETTNFTSFSSLGSVLSIEDDAEFPYELPKDFMPEDYQGFVVTDSSTDSSNGELALVLSIALDNGSGGGAGSGGDPTPDSPDTPACLPGLPMLSADMGGVRGYNVGGTISISYRETLVDGQVVNQPVLKLDQVQVPRAPGPFLYLSKRPVSPQSWEGDEDIFIPIEGTNDGSFTKEGTFTQDLEMSADQVQEYQGGAFIVWCRPFSVWMGGGQIQNDCPKVDVTQAPLMMPTESPVAQEDTNSTSAPNLAAVPAPTLVPITPAPTPAPTPMPTMPPTPASVLPILSAQMFGVRGYNVGGTFTISYRRDLVGGAVVMIPVLTLTNTEVPSAPGPFLYLSKRPSAQNDYDDSVDVFIPIEGTDEGSFTKEGTFSQDLGLSASEVQEYANGSFIVWCRPFSVWMGGGQIRVQ